MQLSSIGDDASVARPKARPQIEESFRRDGLRCTPQRYGATLWDNLHFQYDIETGVNYFPQNVYSGDYLRLQDQLRPPRTYPIEVRDSEVWVDLG